MRILRSGWPIPQMAPDPLLRIHMPVHEADVCIIGGGITSAMLAQQLSELRPDLAIEAHQLAARLSATSAPVVIFVGPRASAFACGSG